MKCFKGTNSKQFWEGISILVFVNMHAEEPGKHLLSMLGQVCLIPVKTIEKALEQIQNWE